ncbi:hypothetical protein [Paenibacillus tuaregi]|uniref:hypothetical protein n=1 Tax=Paenibacillus tuaregi TaxID=1816681 RepID=UPI000837BEB1|nr:hypothetical protein [Paenibacillus tuaregi]
MTKRITLQEMDESTVALIKTGLFGTTNNSGNAYSVTVSSDITKLEPGLPIRILINVDSTGAPTLNVNGLGAKPVLKSNGNAANFKLGGLYTVAWNGSTAFILQGEGGEYGTATAADVLAGKTIGTDSGIVSGSMVNQGAKVLTPSTSNVPIPAGYYNGSGYVAAYTPGKRFARGIATTDSYSHFAVTGLAFKPGTIIFEMDSVVGYGAVFNVHAITNSPTASQSIMGFYYEGHNPFIHYVAQFNSNGAVGIVTGWGSMMNVRWMAFEE